MKESDLLVGIKTLWDNSPTLPTLAPGGLHEGRVATAELPAGVAGKVYASVRAVAGEPEWVSEGHRIQGFTVTLMAWVAPATGVVAAAKPIQAALDSLLARDRRGDLTVSGARVVDIRYVTGELREDEAVKESSDVYLAGAQWEVKLQYALPGG